MGLGLGLSTVYGIIDRHKGTISVNSELGKGTVFFIKLPVGKSGH
jgi:signal transduction histidine kinase